MTLQPRAPNLNVEASQRKCTRQCEKKRSFLFGRPRASSNIDLKEGAGGNRLKFSNISDERFFRKHRNENPSLFVAMRLHFAGGAVSFLGFLLAQTFIAALTCPSHSLRSSRALSFMNARAKAQPRRLASGLHVLVAVSTRTCDSYRDWMCCSRQGTCIF